MNILGEVKISAIDTAGLKGYYLRCSTADSILRDVLLPREYFVIYKIEMSNSREIMFLKDSLTQFYSGSRISRKYYRSIPLYFDMLIVKGNNLYVYYDWILIRKSEERIMNIFSDMINECNDADTCKIYSFDGKEVHVQ